MKPIKVGDTWFDWDERKSEANLENRKFNFEAVIPAFFAEDAIDEWNSWQDGEHRNHVIAHVNQLGVIFVVYTLGEYHGEEKIHIVSARHGTPSDKKRLALGY